MQFSVEFSGKIRPRRDPQVGKGDGCPEEDDACLVAVRRGHLENLKWVRANRDGAESFQDEETCSAAAKGVDSGVVEGDWLCVGRAHVHAVQRHEEGDSRF
jgi:hypothetical protein